jgi:hypothetical protein
VGPRVQDGGAQLLTSMLKVTPPQSKPQRPPPLKTRKRARPAWQPAIGTGTTGQTATEPRLKCTVKHGPMFKAQGKNLMLPAACVNFHPFAEILSDWETGVPVDCGTPWAWETIIAAVKKGAHKSATMDESIALNCQRCGLSGQGRLCQGCDVRGTMLSMPYEPKGIATGRGPTKGPKGTHDP